MRITVIDVEHDDAAAAIAAIHAALGARSNGTMTGSIVASQRVTPELEAAKPKKKKAPDVIADDTPTVQVSKQAYETWEWLVKHDRAGGIHVREVAAGMGLKQATAQWRLTRLRDAGLAYVLKRGHYRAGERR